MALDGAVILCYDIQLSNHVLRLSSTFFSISGSNVVLVLWRYLIIIDKVEQPYPITDLARCQ